MKDITTGEVTPPLPHDEYTRRFQEQAERERRAAARHPRRKAAAPPPPAPEGDEGEGEDPLFAGKPLSAFDGIPDERLEDEEGVGEATAKKIVQARRERDANK